jgi:hypothetical protein
MNPDPQFFRDAAVAAANAEIIGHWPAPETRYWCEQTLGVKRNQGLFGFGDYAKPNHARVITFLFLEILAREGL